MKVLITGGTGFVGSHVCRQLLSAGHTVRLLVRSAARAASYYRDLGEGSPEFVIGDVTDIDSVRASLQDCDAVVHAAAATPMQAGSVEQLFAVNVGGVRHVVGTALELGIQRIVCISSITAIFNPDPARVTADAPLVKSRLPYGQSKVEAERYLRELQQQQAPVSIVYPGGVIGPDDPGFSDSFKALKHRMENGFRIFGDGGIQYVDVRDLAALVCSLVLTGGSGRFLVPGVYSTWTALADTIESVSGCRLQRIPAQGWKLRLVGRLTDIVRLFKSVDSPISAETMRYATLWPNIRNSPALAERGLALRSSRETFSDAIAWMVKAGHIAPSLCPGITVHE
ncbi:MAG: SDR family NAD(P)-dependent oxidoreductase [Halioglobus sp.]|nr:SDR family NAD(P)-dependent oxidoreductase [Halioglobus sp.]